MKNINFENSYAYVHSNSLTNNWRTLIKSVLEDKTKNKKFYLTKECRAEHIGLKPYYKHARTEFSPILTSENERIDIRDISIFKQDIFNRLNYTEMKGNFELRLKYSNYKKIDFDEIFLRLNNKQIDEIYAEFEYTIDEKQYSLFTKLDYVNFGENNQKNYIQPTQGYVPFLKNNKVYLAYLVKYIEKLSTGNLEFLLRDNAKISEFIWMGNRKKLNYFILRFFVLIFDKIFPFIKISGFAKRIVLSGSVVTFYEKG